MNTYRPTVNELLEDEEERPKTSNAGRVHSTDTEAEAEAESERQQEKFSGRRMKENKNINIEYEAKQENKNDKKNRNGFERLISRLPSYEYEIPTKTKNQRNQKNKISDDRYYNIDKLKTDNNRFISYLDAFSYIAEHCQKYHEKYTRDKCRQYLKECYIIDFSHDEFIPILTHLSQKEFNKYFSKTQRELKYM